MRHYRMTVSVLAALALLAAGGIPGTGPVEGPAPVLAEYTMSGPGGDSGWLDPDLFGRISREVEKIGLVDTHEHLVTENLWLTHDVDFFYWFSHYSSSDLVSSGMPWRELAFIRDASNPLDERWQRMAKWWPRVRYTGYGQALRIAARDLYGVEEINEDTWRQLSEEITAAHKPGYYDYLLREKAGIDMLILDSVRRDPYLETDLPDYWVRVECLDHFVMFGPNRVPELSQRYGIEIDSLDDLLSCLDKAFERIKQQGFVGLKCRLAYRRILRFEKTSREDAELWFGRVMEGSTSSEDARPLQDFIMHQIVRRAGENGLPYQIHTGLHEGNGNVITNSRPTHLANLFQEYPQTTFDLFHGSYPYMGELATLAKNFQNVYLDMCWLAIISPTTTRLWLHQWLETVPVNKILAFGGDYLFPEGTYAHAKIARRVVAETLTEKVIQGYMSEEEAVELARMILRRNAVELFGLEEFLED